METTGSRQGSPDGAGTKQQEETLRDGSGSRSSGMVRQGTGGGDGDRALVGGAPPLWRRWREGIERMGIGLSEGLGLGRV